MLMVLLAGRKLLSTTEISKVAAWERETYRKSDMIMARKTKVNLFIFASRGLNHLGIVMGGFVRTSYSPGLSSKPNR